MDWEENEMHQDKKLIPFRAQTERFTVFKDEGCYYIDKTAFIQYLIERGDKICVVTRPRRFGKTLMLRMLQTFLSTVSMMLVSPSTTDVILKASK